MSCVKSLIIQSIGSNHDDAFRPWMEITEPLHKEYAAKCDADFEFFVGNKEPGLHPTWSRIIMFLDAFAAGYDKVLWLDADTLVVNQDRNVFPWASRDETTGEIIPADKWDVYNDGVLIASNTAHARACFEFVWANRRTPFEPWHVPGIPELDWILDYVYKHPDSVEQLSLAYNWMPYPEAPPYEEAVIMAWHGMALPQRFDGLHKALEHFYG
jgi:hypothetical protein